jgi:hypothetical protein
LRVPRSAPIGSAVVPDVRIEVDKALVTTSHAVNEGDGTVVWILQLVVDDH